ncbi:MAG TPA: type I polyketide synthase, partial [Ktedonobacteraceae bacterium]|nr:type I polyketide synthase [Ktedonobacteraceae bacterium]
LIMVPEKAGYEYQEGGIASPDGRCRAFDARAKGSPLGNGVAAVVLKRLDDALRDGDTIHAVIKGSAINNDGALKVGFTAPSVNGQAAVITEALANAGIDAEDISYVEAHGTATALGDTIEVAALIKAFEKSTQKTRFCAIGSVKTNVGHLDRAAGVTGLIKTALALQHRQIPPSLNYEEPNPEIDLYNSPFYVNTRLQPWWTDKGPLRAGVSAFGIGGTNAHVIVEEAPVVVSDPSRHSCHILPLSARTETALEAATENLHAYLQQHPDANIADVAYTLQMGRKTFDHCRALVCSTHNNALHILETKDASRFFSGTRHKIDQPLIFLFAGVGEQYPGMAQDLYDQEQVFRTAIDHCCQILQNYLGVDFRPLLFPRHTPANLRMTTNGYMPHKDVDMRRLLNPGTSSTPAAQDSLTDTALAQPAIFIVEYALAQLLMQWGLTPKAMIGYSLGEYVAACVAGVFTLEDALFLVAKRAQLIQASSGGAMLAVPLSESAIQPYLSEQISLAAVNSPLLCVLAGPLDAIKRLEMQLSEQEIISRRLETTHAFHSSMLFSLQPAMTALARQVTLHPPQLPYISNVTGTWITPKQATDPTYWAQHMCRPVRMAQGLEQLLRPDAGEQLLLEIGPGQALTSMVKQHPMYTRERHALVASTLPSIYERETAVPFLMTTLAKLWLAGATIEWPRLWQPEHRQRIPLPTYPFERKRYWIDPPQRYKSLEKPSLSAPGKKAAVSDWFYVPRWEQMPLSSQSQEKVRSQETLLVFLDHHDIGMPLIESVAQTFRQIICVEPGTQFAKLDSLHFTLRPEEQADYAKLIRELSQADLLPQKIVHLWSITGIEEQTEGPDFFEKMQRRGFYSLLFLVQALSTCTEVALELMVVANNVHAVSGKEMLSPEKAPLSSACMVIAQEYLNISCRNLDIELALPGSRAHRDLITQLCSELFAPNTGSTVAYRDQQRWVQTYEPWKPAATQNPPPLRHRGVYLITGGLGGVGLVLAEHLAQSMQARLVL